MVYLNLRAFIMLKTSFRVDGYESWYVCTFCPLCHYFGKLIWYICTFLQFRLCKYHMPKTRRFRIIMVMFIGGDIVFCWNTGCILGYYYVLILEIGVLSYALFKQPQVGQHYLIMLMACYTYIKSAKTLRDDIMYLESYKA